MGNRLSVQFHNGWSPRHLLPGRFFSALLLWLFTTWLFTTWPRVVSTRAICLFVFWLFISPQTSLLAQSVTPSALYDPLSPNEEQAALNAAFAAGAAAGADSVTAASVLQQEVLLVERHQDSKEERQSGLARRRSDTYIYDYTSDTLKHVIVDLNTQEVEVVEELRGVQLPLTSSEATRAYYLAFSHEPLRQRLNDAYRQVAGEALTVATQLDIKAFIFTADAMPDTVNEYSEECGVHRCAQIQFYTKENMVLDVQPIVDLSREIVVQDVLNVEADLYGIDGIDSDIGTESDDDQVDQDESSVDSQPAADEGIDSSNGSDEIFLPFIARKFFKAGSLSNELILDQILLLWWCDWMSRTSYGSGLEAICLVQKDFIQGNFIQEGFE